MGDSTGVAQILNRLDRKTFNDADQRLFEVNYFAQIVCFYSLFRLWINILMNFKFL